MKCRLLFFSVLREVTGSAEMDWPLPRDTYSVSDLMRDLSEKFPRLAQWEDCVRIAINLEYAQMSDPIPRGAEVAVMPPVQGG